MNHKTIFIIIISIIVFDFLLSRFLEFINKQRWTSILPKEVDDVFDKEKYEKSLAYKMINYKFGILTSSFSFAIVLLMFFLEGFAYVDGWVRSMTEHTVLITLMFFGILMFASDLLNTPFSVYDTFVIEEKFGFNKTTVKTFILDKIKSWLLGIIIGGGILAVIVWFYELTTDMFWIYTWILITAFMLFMNLFYSNLIVPLFNKQAPLEEGELRDEIEKFSKKAGFRLKNIYVIDGSKRSTKANAYFTGFGAKKRVVLYDTLIKDLTREQVVAVLAHEIGHYKKKHTLTGLAISVIQTGLTLFVFSLFIDNPMLSKALGVDEPGFHISAIAFAILYSPISSILGLGLNMVSRNNEYAADRFASDNYDGKQLVTALKQMSSKNLSNLTPHPVYVFFNYSHPTLLQRIRSINKAH